MTLYCNKCVLSGTHEYDLERVFMRDGSSWCITHFNENIKITRELDAEALRRHLARGW